MKRILGILSFSAVLFSIVFLACNRYDGSYYGPMGRGHMYGMGGPFMGILWIALLLLIGYGVYYFSKNKDIHRDTNETPFEIIKKRYAKGEITKEEYERLKEDLK